MTLRAALSETLQWREKSVSSGELFNSHKSEATYLATLSTARHVIEQKLVGCLRELSSKGRRVDEVMRRCASEAVVRVRGMTGPSHRRGASPYIPRPQPASRTTS